VAQVRPDPNSDLSLHVCRRNGDSMTFKLVWICRKCFCEAYPNRALGLTSNSEQECCICGRKDEVSVLFNNEKAEEVKRRLTAPE